MTTIGQTIQPDQLARECKAKHLFIAALGNAVVFQCPGAHRKQRTTAVARVVKVLTRLYRGVVPDDLVEFGKLAFLHPVRQAQASKAAVTAGDLHIIDLQGLVLTRHVQVP
jgi:hypothetical protein